MGKGIIEKLGITNAPWRCNVYKNTAYILSTEVMIVKTIKDSEVTDRTWDRQIKDHQLIATAPEILKALIKRTIKIEAYKSNGRKPNQMIDFIQIENISLIEKATNKSWEDIKGLL